MFHLKKIKTCEGREGEAFSADLYNDAEKIGTVNDSGNGSCTSCYITEKVNRQAFADFVEKWAVKRKVNPECELEKLAIDELLIYNKILKVAKKFAKTNKTGQVIAELKQHSVVGLHFTGRIMYVPDTISIAEVLTKHNWSDYEAILSI